MTLAHDVAGDGPAVVLLHSGACDRRMWDPQWPALLDAGYRVVRCDFRGFGESPAPDGPYSDAVDVIELMRALEIDRAALVGSSYGGGVALDVATRRPDGVAALALLSSALPGHQPSAALRAYAERENALVEAGDIAGVVELNVATWLGPEATPEVRDRVRAMQQRACDLQLAVEVDFPHEEAEVVLSAITAPCLVVSGAHDLVDYREIAAELARRLSGARHVELPWAGHLPSLERPAEVTGMLLTFLREGSAVVRR